MRSIVYGIVLSRYLSIHPGDRLGRGDHVGVYLHSLNASPIKIAARLTVVNHKSHRKNLTSGCAAPSSIPLAHTSVLGFMRVYDRPSGYGFGQILTTAAVQDPSLGFLSKGWVTIVAEVFRRDDDLHPMNTE